MKAQQDVKGMVRETVDLRGCSVKTILHDNGNDYICVTDFPDIDNVHHRAEAWFNEPDVTGGIVQWEKKHNPDFAIGTYYDILREEIIHEEQEKKQGMTIASWVRLTGSTAFLVLQTEPNAVYMEKQVAFHFLTSLDKSLAKDFYDKFSGPVDIRKALSRAEERLNSMLNCLRDALEGLACSEDMLSRCPINLYMMTKGVKNARRMIEAWFDDPATMDFFIAWEKENNPLFEEDISQELMEKFGTRYFSIRQWVIATRAVGLLFLQGDDPRHIYTNKDLAAAYHVYGMVPRPIM